MSSTDVQGEVSGEPQESQAGDLPVWEPWEYLLFSHPPESGNSVLLGNYFSPGAAQAGAARHEAIGEWDSETMQIWEARRIC